MTQLNHLIDELEQQLSELHQQQVKKAEQAARLIRSNLTSEDLLNPDNFNEIISDPNYMYEDGQAAGILSAKLLVRSYLKGLLQSNTFNQV